MFFGKAFSMCCQKNVLKCSEIVPPYTSFFQKMQSGASKVPYVNIALFGGPLGILRVILIENV